MKDEYMGEVRLGSVRQFFDANGDGATVQVRHLVKLVQN